MGGVEQHDVAVVGGGPAGVSCALECHDVKLDVVLLEERPRLGGQLADVLNSIRNLPAGLFSNGEVLRDALEESASLLGERRRVSCEVNHADLERRSLAVGSRRIEFRALVIASGRRCRLLPFALEGALGGDITYQVERRWESFAGRSAAVVGGGDSAALDALELARAGSRVRLLHRSPALTARPDIVAEVRAEPRIEDWAGWEVASLQGVDRLEALSAAHFRTGERRVLPIERLVVKLGYAPNTQPFRGQLELDREGAVVVGPDLATSRPGVFAAGDVVAGSYPRVATAMGQGVLAARSLQDYVRRE
jgi:thioredoxin reductase (NADPH)